jgi:hypothetical protein
MGQPMTKSVWWRDFNQDKMHRAYEPAVKARAVSSADIMAHRHFMDDCTRSTRSPGNSGYVKAVKPYWDARDKAYYVDGVSADDACVAGYKAMMAHYDMPAPAWAWWV